MMIIALRITALKITALKITALKLPALKLPALKLPALRLAALRLAALRLAVLVTLELGTRESPENPDRRKKVEIDRGSGKLCERPECVICFLLARATERAGAHCGSCALPSRSEEGV